MFIFKRIFDSFTRKERLAFFFAAALFVIALIARGTLAVNDAGAWQAVPGGAWREGVVGQPIAINPIISDNAADLDLSRLIFSSLADLLDNYEVSADGKTYTLKLKEGLAWSNGVPLTSDDVIFTIEAVEDPESRSPLAKNWQGVVAERVSELRVTLTLPAPYAFFKENMERLPILPVHIFGSIPKSNFRLSTYNLEPVGSGPYRFQSFSKRKDGFVSVYHLTRNEHFAGPKPYIKDFYFVFYESEEKLLKAFAERKIRGFGSLSPLPLESLPRGVAMVNRIPTPGIYALFFNENRNPALKDAKIRAALAKAVDKRRIISEVFGNNAEAAFGPLGQWGAGESLETIASSAASEIKGDLTLTLIVPQVDFLEKTAAIIKENWLAAGVKDVNVITLPARDLLEKVIKTADYEVLLFGTVLQNPLDLFPFWHSSQRFYPGLNLSLYRNPKVDTLLEKARQTSDESVRADLSRQAEKIIVEDNAAVFLFSLPYTYVHSKNLGGFQFEASGRYLVAPSDRFQKVEEWHLAKARIVK